MDKKFTLTGVSEYEWRNGDMDVWAGHVSDGYHTMHELYQHRMALTAALLNLIHEVSGWNSAADVMFEPRAWKSKLHSDGTMFDGGYFIVGAQTPAGQISYHYKLEHWDAFCVPEVERAPDYDGHTAADVVKRLGAL